MDEQILSLERSVSELRAQVASQNAAIQRLDDEVSLLRAQSGSTAVSMGEMRVELRQVGAQLERLANLLEPKSKEQETKSKEQEQGRFQSDIVKIIISSIVTFSATVVWYLIQHAPK